MRSVALVPVVTELTLAKMVEHGLPSVMGAVLQIQMSADGDTVVTEALQALTSSALGNLPTEEALAVLISKLG